MKYSENLNLKLPEGDDTLDVSDLSENFEALDEAVSDAGAIAAEKAFKVGDTLTTWRTDLGGNWLLCNGAEFDPAAYPELAAISNFPLDRAFYENRPVTIQTNPVTNSGGTGINYTNARPITGQLCVLFHLYYSSSSSSQAYSKYVAYDTVNNKIFTFPTAGANSIFDKRTRFAPLNIGHETYIRLLAKGGYISFYITTSGYIRNESYRIVTSPNIAIAGATADENIFAVVKDVGNNAVWSLSLRPGSLANHNLNEANLAHISYQNLTNASYYQASRISLLQYVNDLGWASARIYGLVGYKQNKILLILKNVGYDSAINATAGSNHSIFALALLDTLNPETPAFVKPIFAHFDYATTVLARNGSENNDDIIQLGDGDCLISLGVTIEGAKLQRVIHVKDFENSPDPIILSFEQGRTVYGISFRTPADPKTIPNYQCVIATQIGSKYVYYDFNDPWSKNALSMKVVDDLDDVRNPTTITKSIKTFDLPYNSDGFDPAPIPVKMYNRPVTAFVLGQTGGGITGNDIVCQLAPWNALPYIPGNLYTYIKAKEGT